MNDETPDHSFPIAGSVFGSPDTSPGFMFWKTFLNWQRELNTRLAPFNLTQPQFSVLALTGWLTRFGDEITQQQIADFAAMDRMHVSLLVRRLLEQGEIERKRNQSDQRVWCISLTDHGRDLLARTLPVVEAFDAEFFQASKEDNELSKPLIAD